MLTTCFYEDTQIQKPFKRQDIKTIVIDAFQPICTYTRVRTIHIDEGK